MKYVLLILLISLPKEDMLIVKDEIFGPVMALMKFK